jgi:superfamily I DNA/RNA helicase
MEFRIADTFTDSLARLTGEEQKAVKTTAFDFQIDPANPGHSFHKLDRAKDKNFWSVRVSRDVRIIVHRTPRSLLLCYVDHHDKAYAWAERRRLETHPKTGAAQLVEIREVVREIERYGKLAEPGLEYHAHPAAPIVAEARTTYPNRRLFADVSEQELLGFGVPTEWLGDVRKATEETVLNLADHLPAEAAEALLELATGGKPAPRQVLADHISPFEHPDAQRRFRVMSDVEELTRALDYPWDKWTVFLHPAQRDLVQRRFAGPARVSGSAGTGKTVVALHRTAFLARNNPDARILLTTFSDSLANSLRVKLHRLIGAEPRLAERIDVEALDTVVRRLFERTIGPAEIAPRQLVRELLLDAAAATPESKFSPSFLLTEWEQVIDAWQLDSWEAYRDFARLGRKTRLPEKARRVLWQVFERLKGDLGTRGLVTYPGMSARIATRSAAGGLPYDFAVVDEAQDVSVPQLRFLAALGGGRADALFFAGDLGQRIFQVPFSWRSLGVDIHGRSATLRVNYRTSHQIRSQADRLLGSQVADVDGNIEVRNSTVSVFNGPDPEIKVLGDAQSEAEAVSQWLKNRRLEEVAPHEIGIFVRSSSELSRARMALQGADQPFVVLDEHMDPVRDRACIATMHLAKGLEYRAVAVMACDDEVIPLQERIQSVVDEGDLEDIYNTERHLLYVACTRARDHLLLTGVRPESEFLHDLLPSSGTSR